jgi:hypothetical protein
VRDLFLSARVEWRTFRHSVCQSQAHGQEAELNAITMRGPQGVTNRRHQAPWRSCIQTADALQALSTATQGDSLPSNNVLVCAAAASIAEPVCCDREALLRPH